MARMRMLRQLGTASVPEILSTIRAERGAVGPQLSQKKRRWRF